MKSNIIQFPSNEDIEWKNFKETIKIVMAKKGVKESVVNDFLPTFKPTFQNLQFRFRSEFPFIPDEELAAQISEKINLFQNSIIKHLQKIMAERFVREFTIHTNNH